MIPIQKVREIITKYEELEKELSSGNVFMTSLKLPFNSNSYFWLANTDKETVIIKKNKNFFITQNNLIIIQGI